MNLCIYRNALLLIRVLSQQESLWWFTAFHLDKTVCGVAYPTGHYLVPQHSIDCGTLSIGSPRNVQVYLNFFLLFSFFNNILFKIWCTQKKCSWLQYTFIRKSYAKINKILKITVSKETVTSYLYTWYIQCTLCKIKPLCSFSIFLYRHVYCLVMELF